MTPYQFVFELYDKFSSPLMRVAANYSRVTGEMQRRAQVISRMFAPVGNAMRRSFTAPQGSVADLMKQLDTLRQKAQSIDIRIDRRGLIEANRDIQWLEKRIDKLQGLGVRGRGGGRGGGGMGWLMAGGMAGALAYGAYNTAEAAANMTVVPAMKRSTTLFQLNELTQSPAFVKGLEKQFAAYAPEKMAEMFSGAQKLIGAGVKQSGLFDNMKMLNNLSALSNVKVDELAGIQAKIRATGRVQQDEMDMFNERGININSQLAKVMGIKENQVKDAQGKALITYEKFIKALELYVGKGSIYEKVYERKRDSTPEGKYDFLMGQMNEKLTALGIKALPTVNAALDYVLKNTERLAPLTEPLEKLFEVIGGGASTVGQLFKAFGILNKEGDLSKGFIDSVSTAINALSLSMQTFSGVIEGLVAFFQRPIFGYDEEELEEERRIRQKIRQMKAGDIMNYASVTPTLMGLTKQLFPDKKAFSPFLKQPEKPEKPIGGVGAGLGKSAGLEASVNGAKTSVTNIHIKSMIERMDINVETLNEAVTDIEKEVLDVLTRLLASVSAVPNQ